MLQHMAGVRLTHVPYKGSAPALLDLLGGRVQIMFDSIASTLPQIRAGKLTPIGVTPPQARERAPRGAHARRVGLARLPGGIMARHSGAGAHPTAGRRSAQP